MDRYEVVERAIRFKNPPRIPYSFPLLGESDFATVCYDSPEERLSETETKDEWGCVWKRWGVKEEIMGEPVGHPLDDWDKLKEYRWPNPDDPQRYAKVKEQIAKAGDRFVLAGIDGILRRARLARGFSNLMMDLYLHPEEVKEFLNKTLDFFLAVLRQYSKFEGIHGISMPEDWGTQTQPFVRTQMFREIFSPIYQKLFDTVHSYGWIMRMHSDGKINDLIAEFIACGLDVIELEQPRALGIEEIGRRYRGKICFEGSVDIQATLPTKNKELICEEARLLIEKWSLPSGGFIGVCYHGPDLGIPEEVIRYALDTFKNYQWSHAESLSGKV